MPNTLFIGKVYHRFEELPSTNDWAAALVASAPPSKGASEATKTKPPEGTVVRADNQTAGRGQLGSNWHSKPGENLLLSILLYPTWLEAQEQFYLSMAVALGLRDMLSSFLPAVALEKEGRHSPPRFSHPLTLSPSHISIKWPNDLYLGDKKTAGILIQNTLLGAQLQSSVVGIGLNVNQTVFPHDLPNAVSLALALGQKFELDELAERLFECLERRYLQLKAGHRETIKAEYEENLWRRRQASRFVCARDGSEFEGVILGVTERGLLRVETAHGVEEFDVKELGFIP